MPCLRILISMLMLASPLCAQIGHQNTTRVIHVFVALADNQNQGIVPVPPRLGNGDDPEHNLYWGSAYGVKTYFSRSADWRLLVAGQKPKPGVLERCVFKHQQADVYLIADAYQGSKIREAIVDFLEAAAGGNVERVSVRQGDKQVELSAGRGADLLAYAGHDGLMDFQLARLPQQKDSRRREVIILGNLFLIGAHSGDGLPPESARAHQPVTSSLRAPLIPHF